MNYWNRHLKIDDLVLLVLYVVGLALYDGGDPVLVPLLVWQAQPLLQPAPHATHRLTLPHTQQHLIKTSVAAPDMDPLVRGTNLDPSIINVAGPSRFHVNLYLDFQFFFYNPLQTFFMLFLRSRR